MLLQQPSNGRKVRPFTLSDSFTEEFAGKQPDWGPVGYFTYKRTYARPLDKGGIEEFWQTCKRVVEGVYTIQKSHCRMLRLPWNDRKAQRSAQEMFRRMWEFKFTPPGRGLWVMGSSVIEHKGSAALNNCAFVSTQNIDVDFAAPFTFLMDMSMLGVGVGGDCLGVDKVKLQVPKMASEPYVVEDSREGWVDLVRTVLNSFVGKGSLPEAIDYSKIRLRGEKIKGFGGVASGPEPLMNLIINITKLLVPKDSPQPITSTQIVDIFNYIGKCVVSGGVRRSAEIMFGMPSDNEFMSLKQDKDALMDRRWASNNSIFAEVGMDYSQVAGLIATNGEPGVIWLDNMRKFSRMGSPPDNKDARVMGSNPCSEQSLESFELCCLVETYPANHDSFEDYRRTLKMAYLYAKTVTLVPTHDPRTNAVMMRNRRIGCSMSGIQQAKAKLGRRNFLNWCEQGYNYIQDLDELYSSWLCVPRSIKTTSVKPSGTVSLLCGATPGIHYPHSQYYIRNIRVQNTSPLLAICEEAGYLVEPDLYSDDTSVVSFPVKEERFSKAKDDVGIWEQFADAADLQRCWADNQVSITVHFKPEEAKDIVTCLEIYETQLKSVSLLPLGDKNHGYAQAPYIELTEQEYTKMVRDTDSLDLSNAIHEKTEQFCDGETCEIQIT
jgi:adenosylcobalamin-dependent ribonucleoside-triphosphate reductase